jgi:hypothetical protein
MFGKQSNEWKLKFIFEIGSGNTTLTSNGQMGKQCPINYTTLSSEQENTAPQQAFKLNRVLDAQQNLAV